MAYGKYGRFDADTTGVDAQRDQVYGYQGLASNDASSLTGTANGQGYQGQIRNAASLEALGKPSGGPSAAELSTALESQNAMRQNLAMAASGTGASNTSLMLNAMNQNAQQQGQIMQQGAITRANEIMQQRAQQMQALQVAGQMYGNAANTQQNAYQQAASIYNTNGAQGAQLAGTYGSIAQSDAQNAIDYYKEKQRQEEAHKAAFGKYLSAGLSTAGTVIGTMYGGPVGGKIGGQLGDSLGSAAGSATT